MTITIVFEEVEYKGELCEVRAECTFSLSPYIPAVMYLSNGDPGYPAEGGEIDVTDFTVTSAKIGEDERPATEAELFELSLIVDASTECQKWIEHELDEFAENYDDDDDR